MQCIKLKFTQTTIQASPANYMALPYAIALTQCDLPNIRSIKNVKVLYFHAIGKASTRRNNINCIYFSKDNLTEIFLFFLMVESFTYDQI